MILEVIAEREGRQRQHRDTLHDLVKKTEGTVRIASAYVTDTALLSSIKKQDVRLLTYLSHMDIIAGSSSLDSLTVLIKAGVQCRFVSSGPRLHAKVYIFGDESAIVTSANLTRKALNENIEVGIHLSGAAARELILWFDTLWRHRADELDLATLAEWQRGTEAQRAEYSALWKKTDQQPLRSSLARLSVDSAKKLRDLFEGASRFFVCNTNRKWSFDAEERMRHREYAAAWEEFKYPTHMDEVRRGDAIFMYAKRAGIIGIGRAKALRQVFEPGNPDRIMKEGKSEWRVPVEWLAWRKDLHAFSWKSPNFTFFEVSGDNYSQMRDGVKKHFLSHS
jgi:PLD-like domain